MRGKKSSKSSSSSLALALAAVAEAATPNKTSPENLTWGLVFLVLFVGGSSTFGTTSFVQVQAFHEKSSFVGNNRNHRHHRVGTRSSPLIVVPSVIERTSIIMSSSLSPSTDFGVNDDNNNDDAAAPVILLIGSCGLDRLLTVSNYPSADAKIRTTSYNERGGGNSANTASGVCEAN
jgi:hypothetical protein